MEYKNGLINLEEVSCKKGATKDMPGKVRLEYGSNIAEIEGINYYYKYSSYNAFGELLAEQIANEIGIPCSHYDMAFLNDQTCILSEVKDKTNTYSVENILKSVYQNNNTKNYNNIENINNAIASYFMNYNVSYIPSELNKIFLFDILIANPDRNESNLKVYISNNEVHFMPLFDNENCFSHEETTYDSNYTLGVANDRKGKNDLYNFLINYPEMIPELEKYLYVLEEQSITRFFNNINKYTNGLVPDKIKNRYIYDAGMNLIMIRMTLADVIDDIKIK